MTGNGYGDGNGNGYGNGNGNGYGDGYRNGDGYGYGDGNRDGDGYGDGDSTISGLEWLTPIATNYSSALGLAPQALRRNTIPAQRSGGTHGRH